jgi:hypothetical protein
VNGKAKLHALPPHTFPAYQPHEMEDEEQVRDRLCQARQAKCCQGAGARLPARQPTRAPGRDPDLPARPPGTYGEIGRRSRDRGRRQRGTPPRRWRRHLRTGGGTGGGHAAKPPRLFLGGFSKAKTTRPALRSGRGL